jgi:hypothetical protein
MNSINFQSFVELLDTNSPVLNDGELKVSLPAGKLENQQLLEDTLQGIGYSFDDVRTVRHDSVNISLNAANWSLACPIYKSWDELFSKVLRTSKLPSYYYIIETRDSSFDDIQVKRALELFCSFRQLLASLADQCDPPKDGPTKGARRLSYIIETDDGIAKYDFEPTLTWEELKKIPTENEQLSQVEKLRKLISLGDAHDSERRSVMRSAFHETISKCHTYSEVFKITLGSVENLHKRYEEHYDLFVRRFSINKVLHEINDKDLTYTSKINEILSSAQNKALTIPGALIVIGAVMKIDQMIDGVAITIAMIITTVIVHRSLKVHHSTFEHIEKQVNAEFNRYDVLNEKVEIRQRAKQTIAELSGLLKKAKENSIFMKRSIWFICSLTVLYIVVILAMNAESQQKKNVSEQSTSAIAPAAIKTKNIVLVEAKGKSAIS